MYGFRTYLWAVRLVVYKLFLGAAGLPGYMGRPCFIKKSRNIYLGKRVRIFPGLRAECHGEGRLFIHDNVAIGQNFHVICSGDLHIGEGSLLSANVFISDTDHRYEDVSKPVFDQPTVHRKTQIGKNCFIGIGACIQAGSFLGDGCVVGSNSVVRGKFPNHSVIVGAPARVVKRYDCVTKKWERSL